MIRKQLFGTKSLKVLLEEMAGEHTLKRALGPVSLTALGVGAIIGAGIFVTTGAAARETAGPALMLSYVIAGLTCIFAALCYAEFASMAPVAGSAYTYAYATLGELMAWIIGWDLVLEYAVGASVVANGWSGYFQSILIKAGVGVPFIVSGSPYLYQQGHFIPNVSAEYARADVSPELLKLEKEEYAKKSVGKPLYVSQKVFDSKKPVTWADNSEQPANGVYWAFALKTTDGDKNYIVGKVGDKAVEAKITKRQQALFDLPAVVIAAIVTLILIKGISESANFNALMVFIKVAAVLFVIVVGAFYVKSENWTNDFAPYGWTGVSFFGRSIWGQTNLAGNSVGVVAGAAIIFFAYIGFDSVSTHAEEAKNPQRDVPIGIIISLVVCTILYIGVVAVLTGMVPYQELDPKAAVSSAFAKAGLPWAETVISVAGVAGITSVLLVMMLSAPRVFMAMARDGLVPKAFFADVHPKFKTPWKSTILIGLFVAILGGLFPLDWLLHLTNIGTLFAFVVVCAAVIIMRRTNPDAVRPFRCPLVPIVPILGILSCLMLMLSLPYDNWLRLFGWLALGMVIYWFYGRHHSVLGQELRAELARGGASPAGTLKG
ncbi:amino acid permease [Anatilimnocola sp. NA78]|uniref:amino acid permease n=1 Tax=Anatilimnocola sp. NA78 TaxID=3415683 RepID=UPI003CE523B7